MTRPQRLLLTCEHAGNRVPERWRHLFAGMGEVLEGHRGRDLGARWLSRRLARATGASLFRVEVTRLLVDANRSEHNPRVFSPVTASLPPPTREQLLSRYHRPHWRRVDTTLRSWIAEGLQVLHLGVHTFTPTLDGTVREMDVGLLYDPARPLESAFCARWKRLLAGSAPPLRVRRNRPYRGTADGIVTALRRRFPTDAYVGVELEVSQALAGPGATGRDRLARVLAETLEAAR